MYTVTDDNREHRFGGPLHESYGKWQALFLYRALFFNVRCFCIAQCAVANIHFVDAFIPVYHDFLEV